MHFDLLVRPSNSHRDVDRDAAANLKNNVGLAVVLEARGRDLQRVRTDIEIGEAIEAASTRDRAVFYLGRSVGYGDGSVWNHSTRGISDGPLNAPGSCELTVAPGCKR